MECLRHLFALRPHRRKESAVLGKGIVVTGNNIDQHVLINVNVVLNDHHLLSTTLLAVQLLTSRTSRLSASSRLFRSTLSR